VIQADSLRIDPNQQMGVFSYQLSNTPKAAITTSASYFLIMLLSSFLCPSLPLQHPQALQPFDCLYIMEVEIFT
jgi:hypothetical protein